MNFLNVYYETLNVLLNCLSVVIGIIVVNKQRNIGGILIFAGLLLTPVLHSIIFTIPIHAVGFATINIINSATYFLASIVLVLGFVLLPGKQTKK